MNQDNSVNSLLRKKIEGGGAGRTLLFLLGEVEYPLTHFSEIVTWCPIRHQTLIKNGVKNYLLGDFSADSELAVQRDINLYRQLDTCLHEESSSNPSLKWAPLAYQNIKFRLSRYQWLKECLRSIIKHLHPDHIVLSSDNDPDITRAIKVLSDENKILITIENGRFDNLDFLWITYILPKNIDPSWFHALRWLIKKFIHTNKKIFIEKYQNISHELITDAVFPLQLHRSINIVHCLGNKIKRLLRLSRQAIVFENNTRFVESMPLRLNPGIWKKFSADELNFINILLSQFFLTYSHDFLNLIEKRLSTIFFLIKPTRIILCHDQADANRLIIYVARKYNIPVDYLPHGIIFEDYSSYNFDSPFQPNRFLAWNNGSSNYFKKYGWEAVPVYNPRFQMKKLKLRCLPNDIKVWKVLILPVGTNPTPQRSREDYWIKSVIEIYSVLTEVGVGGKNISVKPAFSIPEYIDLQERIFEKMKKSLNFGFQLIDPSFQTQNIYKDFDLVLMNATTGIYEVVFSGIPAIIYWPGINYCGALSGSQLPMAGSKDELRTLLKNYQHEKISISYAKFVQSLQSGGSII